MELMAWCVSRGFEIDGPSFGKGSGLGSGGGDGEWSSVIGVVGILSVNVGSSTSGGESSGSSENRLLITRLISSRLSSSTSLVGSLASGGCGMLKGIMDEVQLTTISDVLLGFLKNVQLDNSHRSWFMGYLSNLLREDIP